MTERAVEPRTDANRTRRSRLVALLPNAALVARREYIERVRSRAFLLTTAILIPIVIGIVLVPLGARAAGGQPVARVGIWSDDQTLSDRAVSMVDQTVNQSASQANGQGGPRFAIDRVGSLEDGLGAVRDGHLSGVLVATRRADGGLSFTYRTSDPGSLQSQLVLFGALSTAIVDWSVDQPTTVARSAFHPPDINTVAEQGPLVGTTGQDPRVAASRLLLGLFFVLLIFIALITYGMWVATSVGSEKSSRVMELLIGAATPMQLLLGKVVGMGAAGLTQYALVLAPAAVVVGLQGGVRLDVGVASVDPLVGASLPVMAAFGLFFVAGFVFYAFLYAAAASLVSRADDIQTLSMPLSIVSASGCIIGILALVAPNSSWAIVLSYVPFTSPFAMLARFVTGRAGAPDAALALVVMVVSIGVVFWIAARVYAAGVLLYGQRPGLRTFIGALRTSV
jgi:ABC-2 type transport system permease protein